MKQIPSILFSLRAILLHALAIPAFFLFFILLYRSVWMVDFLGMGQDRLVFNTLMLMCIIIVVMGISRMFMAVIGKRGEVTWGQYVLWSLAEMVIAALFMGLYMTLMYQGKYDYFLVSAKCLLILFASIGYAYLFINLLLYLIQQPETKVDEDGLLRFYDNTQRLKLVIAADAILYIQAEENYIHIYYLKNNQMCDYSLRNSMRSVEEMVCRHGIVRCQRSYFINPRHVKVVRRDKEGVIVAELNYPHVDAPLSSMKPIPISPKYYQDVNNRL